VSNYDGIFIIVSSQIHDDLTVMNYEDKRNHSMFWDTTLCTPLKVDNVSEEHVTSTFRVEEYAKQGQIFVLPPVDPLCTVRKPMETSKLSCPPTGSFCSVSEPMATDKFSPVFIYKPELLASGLLCLLPASH
jgi:hypothetical protein